MATQIDNVMTTGDSPKLVVENDKKVDFTEGPSYEFTSRLGKLELVDTYDEEYLVAFTIVVGQITPSGEWRSQSKWNTPSLCLQVLHQ